MISMVSTKLTCLISLSPLFWKVGVAKNATMWTLFDQTGKFCGSMFSERIDQQLELIVDFVEFLMHF